MEKKIRKIVGTALELPKESILNIPLITIAGKEELIIENYKGIIEYNENSLKINSGIGAILIEGENLSLKSIFMDSITICGSISSIKFLA